MRKNMWSFVWMHICGMDSLVGHPMSEGGRVAESARVTRRWVGMMTYPASEEGPVYQSDLW